MHDFDPLANKPIYSIDTPPPYVSAAHLHVGHAMSYSQAEFIVRYRRMKGYSIFYPMGFDDNGLPTERFVEKKYNVNKKTITRRDFRELCIKETRRGAEIYEEMWRALGLSVDWKLRYSTIDDHCRKTAQISFIDLYRKGLLYRANEPVLWDTADETSLAQADVDAVERTGRLYDIAFAKESGTPLVITTSRPELIPSCVAVFFSSGDARYTHLRGSRARVPLFNYEVPILESTDVDPAYGTGIMMVCTFGDGEDVKKWRECNLGTRIVVTPDGRLNELAGRYAGLQLTQARSAIVNDLKETGAVLEERATKQVVSVAERSGQPVEFQMVPQWFIRVLDFKDEFLARSRELDWRPQHMKTRLDQWIDGLKYDWNISRQRFYGVPFPVWYVKETGDVILADGADLPIDPTEDGPPDWAVEKFRGMTIVPETDVMDTWMTSSLSPLINANWAQTSGRAGDLSMFPMSVRVQAFEIIRTWLFYTLVKGHFHCDQLPWNVAMISGWGLNEQGKKISKRDLEAHTDADGFNRYDPAAVIKRYGADALRYWAAGAKLGQDLRYNEKDVKAGRKIVVKLWNVMRLCSTYLTDFEHERDYVPLADRPLEDRFLVSRLDDLTARVSESFESYDYAVGREALEKFFWNVYCDNYLEVVKDRFWHPGSYGAVSKRAAQATLWESLRRIIALFAPFLPFISDEIYRRTYAESEGGTSIHQTSWPVSDPSHRSVEAETQMNLVLQVLDAWRFVRTTGKFPARQRLARIDIDTPDDVRLGLQGLEPALRAALRCEYVGFGEGTYEAGRPGWRLGVTLDAVEAFESR